MQSPSRPRKHATECQVGGSLSIEKALQMVRNAASGGGKQPSFADWPIEVSPMKTVWLNWVRIAAIASIAISSAAPGLAQEPLPSWNDTAPKKAVLTFVERVTRQGSPDFVPPAERIATFDNDGTLWAEQPIYVQLAFALERVKALAPQHPEWKDKEPFASLLKGDVKGALAGGERAMLEIIVATHAGMTTAEFEQIVNDWIATAKHPKFKRPYTECVYQPMVELLAYLRANGFKTFIVSGGGIEFMRPWT